MALIEKGAAKLHGSYEALEGGSVEEALRTLTGFPTQRLHLVATDGSSRKKGMGGGGKERARDSGGEEDPDVQWARLLSFHEAGFLLGASCGCGDGGEAAAAAAEAMGLLVEHAYSVLEVRAVAGPPPPPGAPRGYRGSGARLLKLRNPWGRLEWRGDWSDDSPLWTAELRAQLGFPEAGRRLPAGPKGGGDGDDGVFWMAWDDFRDYFTAVDVCRVRPEWAEVRFGLSKVGPLP